MSGNDATNLSISCVNTGTISAISPPITTNASTRPIGAPTPRGIPRRWSIEANDDNGTAMITTISTASRIVASCSKIIPATTRPNASRTVRYSVPGVILESDIASQGCPIPRQVSRRAAVRVARLPAEDPVWAVRASIFITCLTDTLFPETGRAMVALLERLGMQLDFPREQTCCRQMHYNTGYVRDAAARAPVVRVFEPARRSLEHLIELSKLLQQRGVDLVVLDEGIDTSTAVGPMFFHILGAIAEFEHAPNLQATSHKEGYRARIMDTWWRTRSG